MFVLLEIASGSLGLASRVKYGVASKVKQIALKQMSYLQEALCKSLA